MTLPLSGLLVVSLEQAVAAPTCTCRLADAGARVIKIERPEGDFARYYDTLAHGESVYFVWLNRGKESVVLDLAREDDKALLAALLAKADVFVQNLKPGAVGEARVPDRAAAARASAPDLLLDLRLRRERPLRAAQGLRHADPGRVGARLDHRRSGGAGPRRRVGVRHRGRPQCLPGGPRGPDRARPHQRGRRPERLDVRRHGGVDDHAAAAARGRAAAAARRARAHVDRARTACSARATAPTS